MRSTRVPPEFDYFYFPFDHQYVSIDFWLPQTTMKGCDELVSQLQNNEIGAQPPSTQLLPATGAWLYDSCSSVHGNCDPSKIKNDLYRVQALPTSAEGREACQIKIQIRRDNVLELIKNIGPLVVVGYVPVLTLWLNPSIPPLVGGRVSSHIFSMVLVMVKYNTNLGLGILTSMIWIDAFYLCLFCMIALGLFETILIHSLFRSNKPMAALTIDGVFRKLMPACVYPCIMGAAFLVGLQRPGAALLLAFGGIGTFTALGVLVSVRRYRVQQINRRKAINALVRAQLHDDRTMEEEEVESMLHDAMHHAFTTFDLDKSGALDRKEMRLILSTMYPNMSTKKQLSAMKAVGSEEVVFEHFHEAVETWRQIAGEVPSETKPSKSLGSKLCNSDLQSKGLKDFQKATMVTNMLKTQSQETKKKSVLRAAAGLGALSKEDVQKDPKFGATSAFAKALGESQKIPDPGEQAPIRWAAPTGPGPGPEIPSKLSAAFAKKVSPAVGPDTMSV